MERGLGGLDDSSDLSGPASMHCILQVQHDVCIAEGASRLASRVHMAVTCRLVLAQLLHVAVAGLRQDDVVAEVAHLRAVTSTLSSH